MVVYQVNCWVDRGVGEQWKEYFINTHLDDVFNTGCFTGYAFRQSVEAKDKILFSAEYYCASMVELERYQQNFASNLKQDVIDHFPDQFTATRAVFEQILQK